MSKQTVPTTALQIATLTLKQHIPSLTEDDLRTALQNHFKGSKGHSKRQQQPDRLLSPVAAAEMLNICRKSLDAMASRGLISKIVIFKPHTRGDGRRVGGRVGYKLSEIQRFVVGGVV
ncbi:MAG: hypothetical protein A2X49_03975 [Lentisphaerae bacterium GWF2_52_8]|nr:MAG: hypothetical protein A2X49_03975 [Lentisphaerae bacterium GWF2_52_8]